MLVAINTCEFGNVALGRTLPAEPQRPKSEKQDGIMVFFWTWLGERRPRHLVKNHLNKIKNHPKFVPKWCRNGSKSVPRSRVGGLRRPGWPKRRQNLQKLVRGPSFWIPWATLRAPFGHPGTVFRPSDLQIQRFFRRPISGSHFVSILGALGRWPTCDPLMPAHVC